MAVFVNVGRGELVDQPALTAALASGRLAGAGLDVFDPEPLPADDPLWDLPNVIISPHTSGSSDGTTRRVAEIFLDNLGRYVRDEPLRNEVTPRATASPHGRSGLLNTTPWTSSTMTSSPAISSAGGPDWLTRRRDRRVYAAS